MTGFVAPKLEKSRLGGLTGFMEGRKYRDGNGPKALGVENFTTY